jgi:hypothetical protein
VKLLLSCLAPTLLGKGLRSWQPARRFTTRHRVALSMFSNANLAVLIWWARPARPVLTPANPAGPLARAST